MIDNRSEAMKDYDNKSDVLEVQRYIAQWQVRSTEVCCDDKIAVSPHSRSFAILFVLSDDIYSPEVVSEALFNTFKVPKQFKIPQLILEHMGSEVNAYVVPLAFIESLDFSAIINSIETNEKQFAQIHS